MKSFNYAIIEVDEDYNNEVELSSGLNLVVNTTIESVAHINRIGRVKAAPESTVLQEGDEIVVHHNILRRKNGVEGIEVKSDFFVKDNIYFVPLTEIFAYRRNGEWIGLDPFVFVRPKELINDEAGQWSNSLDVVSFKKMVDNRGFIEINNKELSEWGVEKGDEVFFADDSEYSFEIEGETLYRMKTSDILGKF